MFLQLGVHKAPASLQKNSRSSPEACCTLLYPTAHRYLGFGPNGPNLAQPELSHLYAKTQAAGNLQAGRVSRPGFRGELRQPCVRIIKPMGAAGLSGAHLSELKFPRGWGGGGGRPVLMPLWFETDHNKPLPLPVATSEATAAKRRVGFTRKRMHLQNISFLWQK